MSGRVERAYKEIELKRQAGISFGEALSFCAFISPVDKSRDEIKDIIDSVLNQTIKFDKVVVPDMTKDIINKNENIISVTGETLISEHLFSECDIIGIINAPLQPDSLFKLMLSAFVHPDANTFSSDGMLALRKGCIEEYGFKTVSDLLSMGFSANDSTCNFGIRSVVRGFTELAESNRKSAKICAGTVLFNADPQRVYDNADNILNQVDELIFSDNGSDNIEEISEHFSGNPRVTIIRNGENKGIAYALNRILDVANDGGYDWVLTLDQDTICDSEMISVYSRFIHMKNLGIVSPFIIHRGKCTPEEYLSEPQLEAELLYTYDRCITSASLTNVKAAMEIGGFNEELFIDAVDFDFNQRLLLKGYNILRANDTYIVQEIGERIPVKIYNLIYPFIKDHKYHGPVYYSVHSDFRLYYIARNYKWFLKKYKEKTPCVSNWANFKDMVIRFLLYPRQRSRIKMFKIIRKGYKDSKLMKY